MKKTFTLLMAAAGMAVAAPTPVELERDVNVLTLPNSLFANDAISVVFTVDFQNIEASNIIEIEGADTRYSSGDTLFGLNYDDYYNEITALINGQFGQNQLGYNSIDGKSSANVVYTYQKTADAYQLTLLLIWGSPDGKLMPDVYMTSSGKSGGIVDFTTLTLSDKVGKVDVYNVALGKDEAYDAVEHLLNPNQPSSPSVPEPTTATLSLLALAGLAARRRRA